MENSYIKGTSNLEEENPLVKDPLSNEMGNIMIKELDLKPQYKATVLEIGPGEGAFTKKLIKIPGIQNITFVDPVKSIETNIDKRTNNIVKNNTEGLESLKKTYFIEGEFQKLSVDQYLKLNSYDAVLMRYLIHHISFGENMEENELKNLFKNAYLCLKKGGKIIIGDDFISDYNFENRNIIVKEFHKNRNKFFKIKELEGMLNDSTASLEKEKKGQEWKRSIQKLTNLLKEVGFLNIKNQIIKNKSQEDKDVDFELLGYAVIVGEKA